MDKHILETQLIDMVKKGNFEKTKMLCLLGADVCFWDEKNKNALMNVEDENIARLLIDYGADVNKVNEKSCMVSPLGEVKNVDVARVFIENGADVHQKDVAFRTPLFRAVEEKNIEKARLILDNDGNDNDANNSLMSLLMKAVSLNDEKMVELLLERNANVNAFDVHKRRALSFVRNVAIAKKIVENGGVVNYRDKWGNTPLINAVGENRIEIVKLFINSGAEINAQDNNGRTALMHAIKRNNIEVIKILVSNRADLHLKDDYGKSAILMADENIRKIMFDTLRKKESSKNMFGQKQVFRE